MILIKISHAWGQLRSSLSRNLPGAFLNKSGFQHSSGLYDTILDLLLHPQLTMPYKHTGNRRHKINKSLYKVTN